MAAGRGGSGGGRGSFGGSGFRSSAAPARSAASFNRSTANFGRSGFRNNNFRNFRGHRFHRGCDDDFFFFGLGFSPFFWGYPFGGWGYPYGYGYPYGGYYPYGYGYGGGPYYQSSYSGDVALGGSVREVQIRLKRLGYYHGSIDGVMGPRTRSAIRAYQRDHAVARSY